MSRKSKNAKYKTGKWSRLADKGTVKRKRTRNREGMLRDNTNKDLPLRACELCGGMSTYRSRYGFCTCVLTNQDYTNGLIRLHDSVIFAARFKQELLARGIEQEQAWSTPEVPIRKESSPARYIPTRSEKLAFYQTWEWSIVRMKTIKKYGKVCLCCGETEGKIVVDHIVPLSKRWDLRLTESNLQVLCDLCNKGKSNIMEDDFRPKEQLP